MLYVLINSLLFRINIGLIILVKTLVGTTDEQFNHISLFFKCIYFCLIKLLRFSKYKIKIPFYLIYCFTN